LARDSAIAAELSAIASELSAIASAASEAVAGQAAIDALDSENASGLSAAASEGFATASGISATDSNAAKLLSEAAKEIAILEAGKSFVSAGQSAESADEAQTAVNSLRIQIVSKLQLDNLIANSLLTIGNKYLVTGATSSNLEIIVTANSVNTLAKKVDFWADNFDLVEYDFLTNKLSCYDSLACVIRNTSGTWRFISDASHKTKLFSSITNLASNCARIIYTITDYTKVVCMIAAPDETYAREFVASGCSVGLTSSDILLYQNKNLGGYISWNGSVWIVSAAFGVTSANFSGTRLTITHQPISGLIATAVARNSIYDVQLDSIAATTTQVVFKDSNGTVITVPDTNMKFFFSRTSGFLALNASPIPVSNIWIKGTMLKEIE
jgi:hypothetical protein